MCRRLCQNILHILPSGLASSFLAIGNFSKGASFPENISRGNAETILSACIPQDYYIIPASSEKALKPSCENDLMTKIEPKGFCEMNLFALLIFS